MTWQVFTKLSNIMLPTTCHKPTFEMNFCQMQIYLSCSPYTSYQKDEWQAKACHSSITILAFCDPEITFLTNLSSFSMTGMATKGVYLSLVDQSFLDNIANPHWLKWIKISLVTKHHQWKMLEMSLMASGQKVISPTSSKIGIC